MSSGQSRLLEIKKRELELERQAMELEHERVMNEMNFRQRRLELERRALELERRGCSENHREFRLVWLKFQTQSLTRMSVVQLVIPAISPQR